MQGFDADWTLPALEVDGVVKGGKVKDVEIGGGTIKALIRDKVLTLEARLLDDRVTLNGEARITEELPWTARMDVRSARLDFILASLLKEVPEDLLINVKGHADMSGDRRHFFSRAVINQLTMTLYGNSFSNDSEFHVEIKDKKVSFPDIRMRSGTTSFRVAGVVDVMHSYDITMEGNSNLAPIKGFSRRIDTKAIVLQARQAIETEKDKVASEASEELVTLVTLVSRRFIEESLSDSERRTVTQKLILTSLKEREGATSGP